MAARLVFLALLFALAVAVIPEHEVTNLPGWTGPLKSKHYSGYITIGANKDKYLHYWLIESESNPKTDPIALWLNGGPGSSSLIGLFTENGQIATNDNSLTENATATPTLFYNPYSWSQAASIVYLEQPAGVGFSYCAGSDGAPIHCANNDTSTAEDAYDFLVEWFKAYPEFSTQDFYITGESYAGNYIPLLAEQVMNNTNTLNLKGLLIGNGCWGNSVGMCSRGGDPMRISSNFYYGHAMYSERLYNNITRDCGNFSNISTACQNDITEMNNAVGSFDVYNVYDTCGSDHYLLDYFKQDGPGQPYYLKAFADDSEQLGEALNDYACGGEAAMNVYLADPSVPPAIHVIKGAGQSYTKTATDLRPLYKTLLNKYRITIYSGDADACVPFWGTEEWTSELGFPVSNSWHPWNSVATNGHPICAGYATQYTAPNQFQYVTIKGAGHMVPTFKPSVALTLFKQFISNQPF